MSTRFKLISAFKCTVLCAKLFYDARKTVKTVFGVGTTFRKARNRLSKYLILATTLVEADKLCKCVPDECEKYLKPQPERKMLLVANLKMNGNMKRLKKYCDCLNKSTACLDKEQAKDMFTRNYFKQLFPDLVDVVVAPPYPYLEAVSNWLRKDCLKCRVCEGCIDCGRCQECVDCSDCNACQCNDCDECCQNKCLNFCNCSQEQGCKSQSETCSSKTMCECENCDLCEFCQGCYKNDCSECTLCIQTAAQNALPYISGGLSGEVTPRQVRELGGRWVIIGSSERRELFHESDQILVHKLRCALMARMQVVYCVTESCRDDPCEEIERQIKEVIPKIGQGGPNNDTGNPHKTKFKWETKGAYLSVLGLQDWQKVAIAYEPVWAIKKGVVPTPEEVEEKCNQIREIIRETVDPEAARQVRILYGGPVDAKSAPEYADQPSIDGFMLGTISFKLNELIPIANSWFIKNRQEDAALKLDDLPVPLKCKTEQMDHSDESKTGDKSNKICDPAAHLDCEEENIESDDVKKPCVKP